MALLFTKPAITDHRRRNKTQDIGQPNNKRTTNSNSKTALLATGAVVWR